MHEFYGIVLIRYQTSCQKKNQRATLIQVLLLSRRKALALGLTVSLCVIIIVGFPTSVKESVPTKIFLQNRCLESKGWLFIAETTNQLRQVVGEEESRLSDLRNVIKETGFDIYNEMQIEHLTFLDARKH